MIFKDLKITSKPCLIFKRILCISNVILNIMQVKCRQKVLFFHTIITCEKSMIAN